MRRGVFLTGFLMVLTAVAQPPQSYYRFPAISGETVVFSAEGDLWSVALQGGTARRLTTHPGDETHPSISPDGTTLAFTARYEGPPEVYTMPLGGGSPVRRTFESEASIVVGWTPSGHLIYSTMALSTLPDPQLIELNLDDGSRRRVPLTPAGDGGYDGRGETLYFVRPAFHRNNTKGYRGGTARDIWRFGQGDAEARNMTADHTGEDHNPMWWNGRIYHISDRDGDWNIWSMTEDGRDLRRHTGHAGWDVQSADLDKGRIVYRVGADLYWLNVRNGRTRPIPIRLASDFDQLREKWVRRPSQYLTSAHLHPDGRSVALTARGRVFSIPVDQGRWVRASQHEGVRYRDAVYMPDGKNLLALSDQSGEFEFHLLPVDAMNDETAVTGDGRILRFQGYPSPDGKRVAYSDLNGDLWVLEIEGGAQTKVSINQQGAGEPEWSPDGRYLSFTQGASNTFRQIYVFESETGRSVAVTSDRINSVSSSWSPDGRFLYFLSDRSLVSSVGSPWGSRQPEPYFDKPWKIYELALKKGLRSPFKEADELMADSGDDKKGGKDAESSVRVEIDWDGLQRRIRTVPVEAGNYRGLSVNKNALFYLSGGSGRNASFSLVALPIRHDDPKPQTVVERVNYYEPSQNGKKILVRQRSNLYVIDASGRAPGRLQEHQVDLSGWSFPIDVRQDFRQLFIDAWRMERDYFYDPGMHGVDWVAVRDKYLPLVERVTTRAELSDLVGQMVGELSALHVSVRGGDLRQGPDQVRVASLGAHLERDAQGGGYRIERIYRSDPDYPEELSPLDDPDLELSEGDWIQEINGVPLLSVSHPNRLLRNQAGRQVLLTVRSQGDEESRRVVVVPTRNEAAIRYRDWELSRRLKVDELGQGRLGYVHLQAMGGRNLTEWYRNFYPVFNRQGLIIDVRHNRGGNIDSIILEKLLRKAWFYWKPRTGQEYWNMQYAFRGHMVVLVNERTASDGEAFAEGFRRLGLGPVIGTRTWGGEIWLSNNNRLSDGGIARAPQTGVYGPERQWLIEGHGVDPDIVVDNPPHATFKGEDAQLEAAVEYLLKKIREEPVGVPPAPAYPDKSKRIPTPPAGGNG